MFLTTVQVTTSNFIQIGFGFVFRWIYDFTTNYALTIFLFALLVKLLLLPISAKQKISSMKMSRLAPQLKELERIYGNDKQKIQEETIALYNEENVSMVGGCLWGFLPLLILFPLYYVIREPLTYVLRMDLLEIQTLKAGFGGSNIAYWQLAAAHSKGLMDLSLWNIDLSAVPSWHIWEAKTWSDIGLFLIPLVSGAFNYASMIMSQKLNGTVTTNQNGEHDADAAAYSANNMKTMTMMMPLMSVFFGFIMPAGMSIYWIAQAALGLVQEYILTSRYRKIYDAEDEQRRERAAKRAAEAAEKERIRAQRRAENPDGITANTSKKKLEQKKQAEREALAREYAAKNAPASEGNTAAPSGDADRPYARGRAYDPNRYRNTTSSEE